MDEPQHPNCRCVIIINYEEIPWQVEIHDLLDEFIGDTDPAFKFTFEGPTPKGILHG